MALTDKYANTAVENGKLANAVNINGRNTFTCIQSVDFDPLNDEDVQSVYRLFKVGANVIPVSLKVITEAITGLTINLGIYEEDGVAYNATAFASALSLATAKGVGSELNGLSALTVDTFGKTVYELAGHTVANKETGYDIALSLATQPSTAGKAIFIAEFVQG